jgi:hypothetical protein
MVADATYTAEETIGELRQTWTTDADLKANLHRANRAAKVIAPRIGMDYAQFDAAYGNDPVIVRLMAAFGAEMAEDTNVQNGSTPPAADFDSQLAAIDAELEALPVYSPKRGDLIARKLALFEAKHGGKKAAPAYTGPDRAA